MKGSIPIPGDDFIATTSNGFKFGIGVFLGGDYSFIALTCEKVASGGSQTDPNTWRHLLLENDPVLEIIKPKFGGDSRKYMADFIGRANVELKKVVGAGIPGWPENDIEAQLSWLCRYGLAFRAETSEVYLK
jgi:hypothetical protein